MSKETPSFSGEESLRLIEQMIGRARAAEKDSGRGWIVWGWLLFMASMIHYAFIKAGINKGNLVWQVFGISAALLVLYEQFLRKYLVKPVARVKTYTNELVNKFGVAFFVSLAVMVYGNMQLDLNNAGLNFGYLLLLYGFWMFIHGSAFRYRLLIVGAIVNWLGALAVFYFREKLGAEILLVHAFCVAMGYLVPGHIALIKFGKPDSLTTGGQVNL
jgi:hypothetical protein